MTPGEEFEKVASEILTQFAPCINSTTCAVESGVSVLSLETPPVPEYQMPDGRKDLKKVAAVLAPLIAVSALRKHPQFFRTVSCAAAIVAKKIFARQGEETAVQIVYLFLSDFRVVFPGDDPEFDRTIRGYIQWFIQSSAVERLRAIDDLGKYLQDTCAFE